MRYNPYLLLVCTLTICACSDHGNHEQVPPQDNPPATSECENLCQPDEKKCDGNRSLVCTDVNDDGCVEWVSKQCGDDESCSGGVCLSQGEPDPSCINECDTENEQICADLDGQSGFKKCANYNDDPCLEWSSFEPCPEGAICADGVCGGCTNECSADGVTECSGDGYKTCVDANGDGCFEWSDITPCEHGCEDNQCICNHECEAEQKECSEEGYRVCNVDASGCRVWSQVTACEYGCAEGNCKEAPKLEPTRYPGDQILSPLTPYVVQSMNSIAAKGTSQNNDVFMKVGDSHMEMDRVFMFCFSKTHIPQPNLNGATFLEGVIDEFQKNMDSFARNSETAKGGKTTAWSNSGPLQSEMNNIKPRFAFYGYGSNDMGQGIDWNWNAHDVYRQLSSNLESYYREVRKGMNTMMSNGIIPLLIGTGRRTDLDRNKSSFYRSQFVLVFDAVARGLAEQYQVPYMNLAYAQLSLKDNGYGLKDGLHHTDVDKGCNFTADGMKAGANVRNRYAIEMLDRAWKSMYKGVTPPDEGIAYIGSGTQTDPYQIDSLPYTHAGDTQKGTNVISKYKCGTPDQSGPEIHYKLVLTKETKIRAFAVSDSEVDVDIHLQVALNSDECIKRHDLMMDAILTPGTYYFTIDTCDNKAGEYLFGVLECEADDPLCGSLYAGD